MPTNNVLFALADAALPRATKIAELSFFRQTRLAQAIKRRLQHRLMLDQPFDRELGVDAASFGQGGLRLIHFTFERTRGSQIQVRVKTR
jgi:hypothetical protein